jgi:hypothetical protein
MGRTAKLFTAALAAVGLLMVAGPAFADAPEPADIVAATGGGSYPETGLEDPADIVAATGGGSYPETGLEDPADIVAATGGGSYPETGLEDPADLVAATGGGTYPATTSDGQEAPAAETNWMPLIAIAVAGAAGTLGLMFLRHSRRRAAVV